jgi:hypothetical protein
VPYRPHGRARVDPSAPQAWATCDRCGGLRNLVDLQWQYQWVGSSLQNLQWLVCDSCLDTPAQFLKAIILSPDPVPVPNPRPENYELDFNNTLADQSRTPIVTEDESTFLIPDNSVNDADEDAP